MAVPPTDRPYEATNEHPFSAAKIYGHRAWKRGRQVWCLFTCIRCAKELSQGRQAQNSTDLFAKFRSLAATHSCRLLPSPSPLPSKVQFSRNLTLSIRLLLPSFLLLQQRLFVDVCLFEWYSVFAVAPFSACVFVYCYCLYLFLPAV